jgi:hypothetical protein
MTYLKARLIATGFFKLGFSVRALSFSPLQARILSI